MSQNLTMTEWVDFWHHKVGVNVLPIISRNKGDPSITNLKRGTLIFF